MPGMIATFWEPSAISNLKQAFSIAATIQAIEFCY
jgi:hypothetical protein